jgi:hypothetical protein
MQQIKSIGVLQTAKVMGVVDLLIGVLAAIAFLLRFLVRHNLHLHHPRVLLFVLLVPILYGIGGFILTAVFCWIYNSVARRMGGIAIELTA